MSVSGNQSYKKIVQLALKAEKLTSERLNRGKFQKKRVLGFYPGNLRKRAKAQNSQSIHLDWLLN